MTQPVARVLVVISDRDDNSSSITLKQAIERAEKDEVIVYSSIQSVPATPFQETTTT
jgi:hypothetical protein